MRNGPIVDRPVSRWSVREARQSRPSWRRSQRSLSRSMNPPRGFAWRGAPAVPDMPGRGAEEAPRLDGVMANNPTDSGLARWCKAFDAAAPILAGMEVEVINCSPASALKAFPRRSIADALKGWG